MQLRVNTMLSLLGLTLLTTLTHNAYAFRHGTGGLNNRDTHLIARAGGVSGGGGNFIAPTPPNHYTDPGYAEKVIKNSVHEARIYFAETEQSYRLEPNNTDNQAFAEIYKQLFDGQKHIQNIISANYPEIEEHRPCFDGDNQPVDGSIINFDDDANRTFCMSAHNLAAKVALDEMPSQATALMVHEYVELAGLNDEQAIILQKKALADLQSKAN